MSLSKRHKTKFKDNSSPITIQGDEQPLDHNVIKQMYDEVLYNSLANILQFPMEEPDKRHPSFVSEETIRTFLPEYFAEPVEEEVVERVVSEASSGSYDSEYESIQEMDVFARFSSVQFSPKESDVTLSKTEYSDFLSEYVNHTAQSSKPLGKDVEDKRKAFLKLLHLPVEEAASWRPKQVKTMENMDEMTLEERGDFLINMITSNFCVWLRSLGGDEKSVIDEDILKELFQVGIDNPASKSIAVQIREKNALNQKLADLFKLKMASFHNVLLKQLKMDLEAERKPARLRAFGKSLPLDLRYKPPKNKTKEIWFGSKRLAKGEDSFEDVYRDVAELSSIREYCRWLNSHPRYKKPKYLKTIGMFDPAQQSNLDAEDTITFEHILSEISLLSMETPSADSEFTAYHFAAAPNAES